MEKITYKEVVIGSDPEFFLTMNDKVTESSKIIPKGGLRFAAGYNGDSAFVTDGVQVEFHPRAYSCREYAGREFYEAFKILKEHLSKIEGAGTSFKTMIVFTEEEMKKLDEEAKRFGCSPSNNLYTGAESKITVDPAVYRYRSAGGHLHIGGCYVVGSYLKQNFNVLLHDNAELAVSLFDLIIGNTEVMIAKDPSQVERRKVYGRAGEYRLPEWGIEYRTPSNWWLRCYQTMQLEYGLARLAASIFISILNTEARWKGKSELRELLTFCTKDDIQSAINNADYDLAKANWDAMKGFLFDRICSLDFGSFPVTKEYMEKFERFMAKPLEHWFPHSPMTAWTTKFSEGKGWETWLKYHPDI